MAKNPLSFNRLAPLFASMFRCRVGLFLYMCVALSISPAVFGNERDGDEAGSEQPTLWIIGDSTVRNGSNDGVGWGEVIGEYFDQEKITIQNRAIGGRSSRTFRTDGRWEKILEEAKPGDYVLMQFGHNDPIAPDDPKRPRGTIRGIGDETVEITHPHTGEQEIVHTFGWYMRMYVREAKEKGMVPIVCSYVPRAPRKGETPDPTLRSYALYAQQVAEQEDAAFIDLFGRIARDYAEIEAKQPHAVKENLFVEGDHDYTHTRRTGAERNAQHVAKGIVDLDGEAGELSQYLIGAPDSEETRGANR